MIEIKYQPTERKALINWSKDLEGSKVINLITRLISDNCEEYIQEGLHGISLPWWSFIALRNTIFGLFDNLNLELGKNLSISPEAIELLKKSKKTEDLYLSAIQRNHLKNNIVLENLQRLGFCKKGRILSEEQKRNITKIASFPASATFSVPGAGKTTEALAFYFLKRKPNSKLLVVAPKNAFAAWEEQLKECVPDIIKTFSRLSGGAEKISRLLASNEEFFIISYQQITRVVASISEFMCRNEVCMFLDESHRIKSGTNRATARSILGLAHFPVAKLIMSGTPMPHSINDLIPQLKFLYPELQVNESNVVDQLKPIYVRTTKKELKLPLVEKRIISFPLAPMQQKVYGLMKTELIRQSQLIFNSRESHGFRRLGKSVARLLQVVSNPALLDLELSGISKAICEGVLEEGDGPKLKYIFKRARELAAEGNKVLIWTSFVRNVEYISLKLRDLGAVFIHGGVSTGEDEDDETREGKIRLFHDDPNTRVLVANPAAASEGISLHKICHNSLYLDRTFNAAHYLQSEDRIHRFGLPPDTKTTIEIIEGAGTVDESVRTRLNAKISAMSAALNDFSISGEPIFLDEDDIDEYDSYSLGLSDADIKQIFADFGKK